MSAMGGARRAVMGAVAAVALGVPLGARPLGARPLVAQAAQVDAGALDPADRERVEQARLERIPTADLGNGYYRNPVLVGPGSDNSVVRVGSDFYMIAGGGFPDELVWHSRDLVNWRPLSRALRSGDAGTWASDIAYHDGRFYLYTTFNDPRKRRPETEGLTGAQISILGAESKDTGDPSFDNIVLTADDPAGPWSEPRHIGVYGLFDPGHIATPDGRRFLFLNRGIMVELTSDGTGTIGDIRTVYDGWDYPPEWVLECHCLEAPKLIDRDGYYYMASAEGGTGGPATAHMGVIARARSLEGPWENSPYNPIVRTEDRSERWWRQGHGTLIDDVAGGWWFLYTGYENGATHLGKQSLLLPIEWTDDGWPRIPPGVQPTDLLRKPAGENIGHGMPLSDDFADARIGPQWMYDRDVDPQTAFDFGGGELRMRASGTGPSDATTLSVMPVHEAYEVEVEVELPQAARSGSVGAVAGAGAARAGGGAAAEGAAAVEGGIALGPANAGLRPGEVFGYWPSVPNATPWDGRRVRVRIRNDHGDVSFFWSRDGESWTRFPNAGAAQGVRRVSLYAAGTGEVVFRDFRYRGLD